MLDYMPIAEQQPTDNNMFIQSKPPRVGPILTVDVVCKTDKGYVLIKRRHPPFKGQWALIGGHVEIGETVAEAAIREFKEETGANIKLGRLIGVYSAVDRDPRGQYVTIAYEGIPLDKNAKFTEQEEGKVSVVPEDKMGKLAFDHDEIIDDYKADKKFDEMALFALTMRPTPYDR